MFRLRHGEREAVEDHRATHVHPDPAVEKLGFGDSLRFQVADQLEYPDHECSGLAGKRHGVGRVIEVVMREEKELRFSQILRSGGSGRVSLEPRVDQNGLAGRVLEGKTGVAEPADLDAGHRYPPCR